jgi:hypothetical protein
MLAGTGRQAQCFRCPRCHATRWVREGLRGMGWRRCHSAFMGNSQIALAASGEPRVSSKPPRPPARASAQPGARCFMARVERF